ncbi:uncharacterized protein LOC5502641 [Nematostella vectensis]|uniref:uncharacterized protein LOC5502641 n=1 Tax=Nematostella vectensis TaxID=45351 RepID=UPI0020771B82|nr:uncharacterized protein LOC5502641 [Nematostella vectensis]XP_032226810.2 uncharacterized protein LOC5502641 [Nematostella vectensis]XP_032226811.2 uncharacterized protein LOC5502641 [Nematostella vectensis]XP_032226812.2 uncharacterized protein LOC5502641 [Nematostella vectensis]XP_032226813.2 uncharacterized protein LOC5502641 [Nematostella vectensis]XP_032226814.2 uncharacterized protein LOC5502641 [Nematostella vectensis]XP_032226815.2 uncharacterized protein LOC5502641 [Nematostella v
MGRITVRWVVTRITVVFLVLGVFQLVTYIGLDGSVLRHLECTNPAPTTRNPGKMREDQRYPTLPVVTKTPAHTNAPITSLHDSQLADSERRKLAADLKGLALALMETQRTVVTSLPVYHRMGEHVTSINRILDSIHVRRVQNANSFNPAEGRTGQERKREQEICPETFQGKNLAHGYPWFRTGFARDNCTDFKPINRLITIILHLPGKQQKPHVERILANIAKYYPGMRVHVMTDTKLTLSVSNIDILLVQGIDDSAQGALWDKMIRTVNTPYVFCASNVTHFDDDIDLERLVRELSTNEEVVIVGGSHRDQKGRWDIGCQQTLFRNWTMYHRGGYYYSFQDCLVCDYLSGPWAAKTDVLQQIGFDESLPGGAFHDLFWRLKRSTPRRLSLSCPDVMFNIYTSPVSDQAYVDFARKWDIKKWLDPDGRVRWYGCRRGHEYTSSSSTCSLTKSLAVPPCDLENLADAIKFVMKECENAGLFCELQEGTLLGAVKLNKVLPWERDADITFLTANYTAFKKLGPKFKEQGYSISDDDASLWCCVDGRQAGGKFRISTSRFTIEMYGQHMMESELLVASGQQPTKVDFAGMLVNVVRNPGMYARNRYGPNHFRHEEHWMDMGRETGWSFYNPGKFTKCTEPGHSACLDQYPADGNLQFSDYTTM